MEELQLERQEKGGSLVDMLISSEAVEEKKLWAVVAEEFDMDFEEHVPVDDVDPSLVEKIPISFAKANRVLPLMEVEDGVKVASANPFELSSLDAIQAIVGRPVVPVVIPGEAILDAINKVYERRGDMDDLGEKEGAEEEELTDLIDVEDEAPIIRWVNTLFFEAVKRRASDIHIEPLERDVSVRYRVDGVLHEAKTAKKAFLPSIISRVKILAKLNIAEKRLPQDGRIGLKIAGKSIDIRVSTIPTSQGERVVMRLLDKQTVMHDVSDLGFMADHYQMFHGLIRRPHGIILVTGPTGSGKTTTLYAGLSQINTPDKNILTVEDPVEYDIEGIGQVHVNPKIDLTFSAGLRAFLRQDPDVIMVGEIRDLETAQMAVRASLTGHLVFSTLHTNDAPGAVARLLDIGVEPFLISSGVTGILAQRLARTICSSCKEPYVPPTEALEQFGIAERAKGRTFYKGRGCQACRFSGYRGRIGVYELLQISDPIRELINEKRSAVDIRKAALKTGDLRTLYRDGLEKAAKGETTLEEISRIIQVGGEQ
jgi:general secretion pathway protein E